MFKQITETVFVLASLLIISAQMYFLRLTNFHFVCIEEQCAAEADK